MGQILPPTPPNLRKVRPELKPAPKEDRHTLYKNINFNKYLPNTLLFIFTLSSLYLLYKLVC